jgi:hypothetical protein
MCTIFMAMSFFACRAYKQNKDGFELLATESRKLVYMIFHANQNMKKEADLPAGLGERLDQVLKWVKFKFVFIV